MNIVIVGTAYPLRGGIAHYNALLADALSASHDVQTVTFKRQYPALLFPGKTQEEGGDPGGVTPAPELVDSMNPFNWVRVGRRIAAGHPDLVLFKYWLPYFGPCFGTIARFAKRGKRARVVFICDNVVPHEHRPGDSVFTRYALSAADGFVVQSAAVEHDLLALIPHARYVRVPHPVYHGFGEAVDRTEARRRLGLQSAHVLLFFGYVRKYKGLSVLLDALKLVGTHVDVHLLVVGEFYEAEQPYRDQIHRLGLEERVTVRSEYLPNEEIRYYFSAADAVILPYTSATQSGIAQIAYNFDTPVIASDVGGLAEVVRNGKTGFLVPPGDADALATRINDLLFSTDLEAMRAAVREEKKRYSWDAMVRGIEELARPAEGKGDR